MSRRYAITLVYAAAVGKALNVTLGGLSELIPAETLPPAVASLWGFTASMFLVYAALPYIAGAAAATDRGITKAIGWVRGLRATG